MQFTKDAWEHFRHSVYMLANDVEIDARRIKKYHIFMILYETVFYRTTMEYAFLMEYFNHPTKRDYTKLKTLRREVIEFSRF